jgi:hypothetical protein
VALSPVTNLGQGIFSDLVVVDRQEEMIGYSVKIKSL